MMAEKNKRGWHRRESESGSNRHRGLFSRFAHKLGRFFRDVWLSILTLVILGAITGGAWVAPPAFDRLFPTTFFSSSGDIVWAQFAYPYVEPRFSSLSAALVAIIIPIAIMLFAQIWVRNFCDGAYAILGFAFSLMAGTFIVVVIKKTIGGMRPHFLTICEPVVPPDTIGSGFQNMMFTVSQVCTGDKKKIDTAMQSFPSGHTEIAFAAFSYLSIYLFTHLRIQSRYRAGYWRMMACLLPMLFATYLSSTLVLNYHHHGYDVIFGALVGVVVALFGYRMVFKSIWDKKFNTVPTCHDNHEEEQVLPTTQTLC